jgi:outer membrane protein OmpA-like peptidoglycan-associated protein
MAEQPKARTEPGRTLDVSSDGERDLNELRDLLVGPEKRRLTTLEGRLEDSQQRAEDVSSVVAEAIHLRQERGGADALSEALTPSVEVALRQSVRNDPKVLADALFPVMGPAIRKSISESLREMLESFNESLEHSFSMQGLKWRIEAIRTGKPFAEVVLMHSLVFRVEQVFLIHKKTGLVLKHVAASAVSAQDPALVSGMLSAIQDFVRDSFKGKQGESLESMTVGEFEVWAEEGPTAVLAAAIRGHIPAAFRTRLEEELEKIHREYGVELDRFEGDSAPFERLDPELAALLEARYREKPQRKPFVWIFMAAVLLILGGWLAYDSWDHLRWNRFADALREQPGIVLTSFGKEGGKYRARGLRDPLAIDPQRLLAQEKLDPSRAEFHLAPYFSLDDAIVLQRARATLVPPATVELSVNGGVLEAAGEAPLAWVEGFRSRAALIPGIKSADDSRLKATELVEFERMKSALSSDIIFFSPGESAIVPNQQPRLAGAQADLNAILVRAAGLNQEVLVEVIGHTDTTGAESLNLLLSKQRAERVASVLIRGGLPSRILRARGAGVSEPVPIPGNEEAPRFNRSVTFRFIPARPSGE